MSDEQSNLSRIEKHGIGSKSDYKWVVRLEVMDEGYSPCAERGVRALLINGKYATVFAGESIHTGGDFEILQEMCDAWNEKHAAANHPDAFEQAIKDKRRVADLLPRLRECQESLRTATNTVHKLTPAINAIDAVVNQNREVPK